MSAEIVQLALFQNPDERPTPAADPIAVHKADDDGDNDGVDDLDMTNAENRAHGVRGALSALDVVDITPAAFWKVFRDGPNRDLTIEWVRKGARLLAEIEAEFDRQAGGDAVLGVQSLCPSAAEVRSHLISTSSWLAARVAGGEDPDLVGLAALSAGHGLLEKHFGRKYAATHARGLSYASDAEMELMHEKELEIAEELRAQGLDSSQWVPDLDDDD
jgi:hypothetical protein